MALTYRRAGALRASKPERGIWVEGGEMKSPAVFNVVKTPVGWVPFLDAFKSNVPSEDN
jgi:hypothetical protein